MHPAITLDDVTCSYGATPVLEGVTLAIDAGEMVALVGPSGAGKTTMLRALLGAIPVCAGEVRIFGLAPEAARGRVGYVPQLETVDWSFPVTVEQVVAMGLTSGGVRTPWPTRAERDAIAEVLERLGMADLAGRHIRNLSGGQQQRAFLARALVRRPDLLLLDEPTSGVDVRTRLDVLALLSDLNRQGITLVLTTHDLNAVAAQMPRVLCLNRRLVGQGAPAVALTPGVLGATFGGDFRIIESEGERFVVDAPVLARSR